MIASIAAVGGATIATMATLITSCICIAILRNRYTYVCEWVCSRGCVPGGVFQGVCSRGCVPGGGFQGVGSRGWALEGVVQ
jgi:hypothetical protein